MKLNLEFCADVVSEKRFEKRVLSILKQPIGTWRPLHDVLELAEFEYESSTIFASWTNSLRDEDGFSLIMFLEEESMEVLTAFYNVKRLLNSRQSNDVS